MELPVFGTKAIARRVYQIRLLKHLSGSKSCLSSLIVICSYAFAFLFLANTYPAVHPYADHLQQSNWMHMDCLLLTVCFDKWRWN